MTSKAGSPDEYLNELPEDRRLALQAVRKLILDNLQPGFREGMGYGLIGYSVPHSIYPQGYHCDPKKPLPFAALASQKNHMAIYLMCVYGNADLESWFRQEWAKTGKKLDMGKACLRFKKVEDLAFDVLAELFRKVTVEKYIAGYEMGLASAKRK
jgi:hypothetical protein